MRFVCRTETMVLADHQVAIIERYQDCYTNSKAVPREELRAPVERLRLPLEKQARV